MAYFPSWANASAATYSEARWYVEAQARRHRLALESIVPIFNPATLNDTVHTWLRKNEFIASFMNVEEDTMLETMATKLRGEARVWYDALSDADRAIWNEKIVERFGKDDLPGPWYLHLLQRKYKEGQNYFLYFVEKAAIAEALGMSGRIAVECIVFEMGLPKAEVEVKNKRIDNIDDLASVFRQLEYDRTFRVTSPKNERISTGARQKAKEIYCYAEWLHSTSHVVKQMRLGDLYKTVEPSEEDATSLEPNYEMPTQISTRLGENPKMIHLGKESSFRHEGRFFDVVLGDNGTVKAYLDHNCECIVLRRQEADKLGLTYYDIQPNDNTWIMHYAEHPSISYFGLDCERPIGFSYYKMRIDQVETMARVYIVRTELLAVPMVIGQSFTEDVGITIFECAGHVRVCDTYSLMDRPPATTNKKEQVKIGPAAVRPKARESPLPPGQKVRLVLESEEEVDSETDNEDENVAHYDFSEEEEEEEEEEERENEEKNENVTENENPVVYYHWDSKVDSEDELEIPETDGTLLNEEQMNDILQYLVTEDEDDFDDVITESSEEDSEEDGEGVEEYPIDEEKVVLPKARQMPEEIEEVIVVQKKVEDKVKMEKETQKEVNEQKIDKAEDNLKEMEKQEVGAEEVMEEKVEAREEEKENNIENDDYKLDANAEESFGDWEFIIEKVEVSETKEGEEPSCRIS